MQKAEQILADETAPYENCRAIAYDLLAECHHRLAVQYEQKSKDEEDVLRAAKEGITVQELRQRKEEPPAQWVPGFDGDIPF